MFLNLSQALQLFVGHVQHLSVLYKTERSTQGSASPMPSTGTITSTAPSPAGYTTLDTGQNAIYLKSQLAYKHMELCLRQSSLNFYLQFIVIQIVTDYYF